MFRLLLVEAIMRVPARTTVLAALALSLAFAGPACKKDAGIPETPAAGPGGPTMKITRDVFGSLPDGTAVEIYTRKNASGDEARIMTYGATLVSLKLPDRGGALADVNLGFDTLD